MAVGLDAGKRPVEVVVAARSAGCSRAMLARAAAAGTPSMAGAEARSDRVRSRQQLENPDGLPSERAVGRAVERAVERAEAAKDDGSM